MTTVLPPVGSAYYETLRPHIIVVVTGHDTTSKYGQVTFKRMDTGTTLVSDGTTFTFHYSPLETMENK